MALGFYGKLPSRGDFIRAGLPGSFVAPWDAWMAGVLHGSKALLGDAWLDAWMEAPVWHFRLPALVCGPDPVCGVFMPSVDKAGRHFPVTLAVVGPEPVGDAWLDGAEDAGIAALEHVLEPDDMMRRLEALPPDVSPPAVSMCRWWTEGAPRVPASDFTSAGLPSVETFVHMIAANLAGGVVDSGSRSPKGGFGTGLDSTVDEYG